MKNKETNFSTGKRKSTRKRLMQEEFQERLTENMTIKELADYLGVSASGIVFRLKKESAIHKLGPEPLKHLNFSIAALSQEVAELKEAVFTIEKCFVSCVAALSQLHKDMSPPIMKTDTEPLENTAQYTEENAKEPPEDSDVTITETAQASEEPIQRQRKVGFSRKDISDQEIIRLYRDEHLSLSKIAAQFDISPKTIGDRLKKNNIPLRPRGRYHQE